MIRILLIAFIVCLMSSTTGAQPIESSIPPECQLLPEHKPDAGVTYQPGIDVHGKSVVPADINAQGANIAKETIVVPLTVNLAERMRGLNIEGLQLEGNLGYIEIHPDGRISHNGQDWTSQVHVICGKMAVSGGGQDAADVINSPTTQTETKQEAYEQPGAKTE